MFTSTEALDLQNGPSNGLFFLTSEEAFGV